MGRAKATPPEQAITPGADFLQLDVPPAPPGGKAAWLASRLREAISDGRLPVGSRVPASRVLAMELRVSRGVVTEAYQRLIEDGHAVGRGRAGTVIVASPLTALRTTTHPPPKTPAPPPALFTPTPGIDIFDALRAAPARIDLTPGLPDLAAFPRAAWLRAEREALTHAPARAFGYGDPRGTAELRTAVADWLARYRGIRATPDEVLIVAGTAQAIGLIGRVLKRSAVREVAVEDPGSLGGRQHLLDRGLGAPPVPVDGEGVRVDALRALGAPAVMLTPAHQFPTGAVLGGERRRELMAWARDGGLVIEDDYDAEHRYDRPPVPALRGMLPDHVFYAGSVSKLLAPALRVGWILAPSAHREALIDAKRFADLGNASLPQLALARLMESGALERHLRMLRRRHHVRRDAMISALRAHLPGAVVHGAAAGLHLMVTLDTARPDTDIAAAALELGVKVQPLSWHTQLPRTPGLVLGYAAVPPGAIDEGVGTLAKVLA